jgi:diguanylate cyclase (GGDEF)-like protein/PAS domain S-box-containing protein
MTSRYRSLRDPATLEQLVRRLKEGIYITNDRGEILDVNPAGLAILGFASLDELQSHGAHRLFVDPEQRQLEVEVLRREGAVREFELELRRPDGEVRVLLDTCYAVADPETRETLFHGILIDITERKRLERELQDQSVRDPLTGCRNRRFLPQLEETLLAEHRCWAVVVVDIDHFKTYNDDHGHRAGDEILVRVARFLQRQVRGGDAVVRIGGDEFLVIAAYQEPWYARKLLRRIELAAQSAAPVPVTVGGAIREAQEGLEQTVSRADHRLIAARRRERTSRPPKVAT